MDGRVEVLGPERDVDSSFSAEADERGILFLRSASVRIMSVCAIVAPRKYAQISQ